MSRVLGGFEGSERFLMGEVHLYGRSKDGPSIPSRDPGLRVLQGYLAQKKLRPQDPTVGMCLGPYGGPRGGGVLL